MLAEECVSAKKNFSSGPRCAQFSCRRSHIMLLLLLLYYFIHRNIIFIIVAFIYSFICILLLFH